MNIGIIFAIISALSFGFYNFFTKLTSEKFDTVLAVTIVTGTSFLFSLIVIFSMIIQGHQFIIPKKAIYLPVVAGIFTGVAEIMYLFTFQNGLPLSIGNPIVVGGTTLFAVLFGIFFLQEQVTILQIFAIFIVLIGLILLAK